MSKIPVFETQFRNWQIIFTILKQLPGFCLKPFFSSIASKFISFPCCVSLQGLSFILYFHNALYHKTFTMGGITVYLLILFWHTVNMAFLLNSTSMHQRGRNTGLQKHADKKQWTFLPSALFSGLTRTFKSFYLIERNSTDLDMEGKWQK